MSTKHDSDQVNSCEKSNLHDPGPVRVPVLVLDHGGGYAAAAARRFRSRCKPNDQRMTKRPNILLFITINVRYSTALSSCHVYVVSTRHTAHRWSSSTNARHVLDRDNCYHFSNDDGYHSATASDRVLCNVITLKVFVLSSLLTGTNHLWANNEIVTKSSSFLIVNTYPR